MTVHINGHAKQAATHVHESRKWGERKGPSLFQTNQSPKLRSYSDRASLETKTSILMPLMFWVGHMCYNRSFHKQQMPGQR